MQQKQSLIINPITNQQYNCSPTRMNNDSIHQKLQQKYQYPKATPDHISADGRYQTYTGHQKEIPLAVTIKILNSSTDPSLVSYLTKLKSTKSEQVIKIYEVISQGSSVAVVTEQVTFGTLEMALNQCRKLDESDALYVAKYLLTGYMEAARNGADWYGTVNDVEIMDSGIKLSWNNTLSITGESSNSLKQVLQHLSLQKISSTQQRLLPFAQSKQLKQLFKLSQSSASEISLSPVMKKKEKYLKKIFRQYLLIRETKTSGEYFDQTVYLGVSREYGFVRVKAYKRGTINPVVLQLNKTKNTFTKLHEMVEEGQSTYLVSAYSNDGTLQSYVQRLKSTGIQLKQEQIEFFFFSMMQPLKAIQDSSIKSLNTSLHIKNIYIESGIPKIGEPLPINDQMKDKFNERADVPDFYHKSYKQHPNTSDPSHDTYSLGVLLHKLMFTQYPIFPENNKVKIPITPAFSPRLKKTLQIFLNEGGKLSDIERKIEVSQAVMKQVKRNKDLLMNAKKQQEKRLKNEKKVYERLAANQDQDIEKQPNNKPQESQKDPLTHNQQQSQGIQDDCFECFVSLELADHSIDPQVQSLQQSPYKTYRLCTKFFCFLLFYVLVMYMFFLRDNMWMLGRQGKLEKMNVTVATVRYEVLTGDRDDFYLAFNQTTRGYADLVNMGCMVNTMEHDYYAMVQPNSVRWLAYLAGGLGLFLMIIIIKSCGIFRFDYIKTKYNYQHQITNFNYSNFVIGNILVTSLIHQHFAFFNIIFATTLPACLGNKQSRIYSTVQFMLESQPQFFYIHLPVVCSMTLLTLFHYIMLHRTETIKYSKLFNPIMLFLPFLLGYWIVVRIGVLGEYFYPSALKDEQNIIRGYFLTGDYVGILGTVPEILWLVECGINVVIDMFYWLLIDKKRRVMIQETSTDNIQLYNQ